MVKWSKSNNRFAITKDACHDNQVKSSQIDYLSLTPHIHIYQSINWTFLYEDLSNWDMRDLFKSQFLSII